MRILFLSTWHPCPPDNGSRLRVYYLLRALSERHTVTLCAFAFDTASPPSSSELAAWGIDAHTVRLDPFAVNRVPGWRAFLSPRPTFARPIPQMEARVGEVLSQAAFDSIIASTEGMAAYALAAPGRPVRVLEEHNSLSRWMDERLRNAANPAEQLRCWASRQKARRYERRLFERFDRVTMVSDQDRLVSEGLSPQLSGRICTIPNGVDCEHNRPGLRRPNASALVYNGSLTYSANYDAIQWFLAEVYPRIKAEAPDVRLTITGSTHGVNLAGLALDDSVSLTGYVADVRIPVAEARVAIAPIRQGGGTRLKILEAMALGVPVVATRKGAEGLNVRDREHLLLADDAASFARRTVELLDDAGPRDGLAANARRLVEEQYDWRCIGAQFVALVEQAVAARRSRP